jgi:hypothetical protein
MWLLPASRSDYQEWRSIVDVRKISDIYIFKGGSLRFKIRTYEPQFDFHFKFNISGSYALNLAYVEVT